MTLVTAVTVNWNGLKWLPGVLAMLRRQSGVDLDILVVDNSSEDGSLEWLATQADVRVVRSPRNTGFAGGANLGIAASTTPYVLLVNPDVDLDSSYTAHLVRALEAAPDAASATGALVRARSTTAVVDSTGHVVYRGCWAANRDAGRPQSELPSDGVVEVFGVCAAAALYRRSALLDVTLQGQVFCEDFFAYLEDVDLDFRLRWAGWHSLAVHAARGVHVRSATGARNRPDVRRHIVKNYFLLVARAYDPRWIWSDATRIAAIAGGVLLQYAIAEPSSLLGMADFVRLRHRWRRDRREIMEHRRARSSSVRAWLEPFPWRSKSGIAIRKMRRRTV